MSDWEWTEHALDLKLGRVASAVIGGDALYLVRHRDLATWRVEGDRAVPWHEPVDAETRVQLDERNLQVAFDDDGVLFALLIDGSTWRRERGGELVSMTAPDVRLAGHYAHRTGFVWDPRGRRVVVVGGDHRNDGYTIDPSTRVVVPLAHGPGHGPGQTVGTAHGVFRMTGEELWLLQGDAWALVGKHDQVRRDRGVLLYWDPQADAVFFVSQPRTHREGAVRVQMTTMGPTEPLALPGSFAGPLEAHEAVAQIDPRTGRLWQIDSLGARYLELDDLGLSKGSPLVVMVQPRRVVEHPPMHWYREALALRQRDEEAPDLGIPVRDGWVLAATMPNSPHLPVGDAGSVLLFSRELPYEYDPWTLSYSNAFEVRIVDAVYPTTAGGMLVEQMKFVEADPVFADRIDTAWDGSTHLARSSKIGGFPALVAGTREEAANSLVADLTCEDCDARLRFVAQLAWPEWDLISARVYIYACPFGHSGAAKAQNV
ncbi:MAG: hypothetical protein H6719_35850 [Sandaracinaceae bacterium]|nr:hypothetical protein [Sandaracinaceae bacterium]